MSIKNLSLLIAVIAMLMLTGAQCSFVAKSGTGSKHSEEENRSTLVVVLRAGRLLAAPVQGVRYLSGSVSGIFDLKL